MLDFSIQNIMRSENTVETIHEGSRSPDLCDSFSFSSVSKVESLLQLTSFQM